MELLANKTVREMLEGVFEKTSADFAIAVSGIAGPSGGTEKSLSARSGLQLASGESPRCRHISSVWQPSNDHSFDHQLSSRRSWRKVEKGIPAFPFLP